MIKNTPAQARAIRNMNARRATELAAPDKLLKFPHAKHYACQNVVHYIAEFRRMNEVRTGEGGRVFVPNFLPHTYSNINGEPL